MKVAAIQYRPLFKDVETNIKNVISLVVEAARNRAELIVLPELVFTGYSFMSKTDARPFAEDITKRKKTTLGMLNLAKNLSVVLVWGTMHVDNNTGSLYNAQALACPDGKLVHYEKINLWGNDYLWAQPGRTNPPILRHFFNSGEDKKVGLLICRDVRDKKDKKWSDFYSKGEADIVCLSANWGDGGFPAVSWMDFVKDNDTNLIVSNRWGKEVPNDFGEGGVCVINKYGGVQCEGLRWSQDCIVYGTL